MKQESIEALEIKIRKEYSNTAGIVVTKNQKIVYEQYFNTCNAASRIHVYSVSKSIISLLIGIAIDKGFIQDVNQKVLDFFPNYKGKKGSECNQQITLKHLMTMSAPYKYSFAPYMYIRYFMSDDWVKFTLDRLGGKGEIGGFNYTPLVGPDILSGILVKATGQSVLDFAREHLFSPLGIAVEQNVFFNSAREQQAFNKSTNISGWVSDKKGINAGGWGLTLSPRDMVKIGQLCLNGGQWNGKQIVSQNWIAESTMQHSQWEKMKLAYGYLWWILDEKTGTCAAIGDGGNVLYFNPSKNIVVAITSLFIQNAKDRIVFIKEDIEPLFAD